MPHFLASSTLFVIDDNVTQLDTLADILESDGLSLICCRSGEEALAACRQYPASVAILDLRLPDMDGLTVLQQLRAQNPEMKVIINTAHASLESAIDAINLGAFAYVQKMGDVGELLAHVHRAFHVQVATYSERLAQEVTARTAELSRANAILREEIAAHTRAEEELQATIRQKSALLNEIHHRTRNNMSVMSALLNFQAKYAGDAHTQQMLNAVQARIDAMSLIHAKLHASTLMSIEVSEYIKELAETLAAHYNARPERIRLTYDLTPYSMMIDPAASFALLVHELVSNALRHAFPHHRAGELHIAFHLTNPDERELRVCDSGVGLPEAIDVTQAQTLGFALINMMASSLRGTVVIHRHAPGTEIMIRFNEPTYPQRI